MGECRLSTKQAGNFIRIKVFPHDPKRRRSVMQF
jgi:hypothetical protein